jgi:GT2 family glycosyltransferase
MKEQTYVIISWSNPPHDISERLSEFEKKLRGLFKIIPLLLPKWGSAKQRDITLRYILYRFPQVKYIIYMEDDVIVKSPCWLDSIVRIMNTLNKDIAFLGLEPASIHCINLVGRLYSDSSDFNKKLIIGFVPACGLYIIRAEVLRELCSKGLGTYSPFMYFFWEDKEFSLKLWLMGYKTASYKGLAYVHLGSTSKSRPIHRRYTRYLGPIIATLINMPLRLAISIILIRLLYTFLSAMRNNELLLFLRANYFLLKELKHIWVHRFCREKILRDYSALKAYISLCFHI